MNIHISRKIGALGFVLGLACCSVTQALAGIADTESENSKEDGGAPTAKFLLPQIIQLLPRIIDPEQESMRKDGNRRFPEPNYFPPVKGYQEIVDKNLQQKNVLVIANEYTDRYRLLSPPKDAKSVEKELGGAVLMNIDTSSMGMALSQFSLSDCQERKEAKIIWFSGHARDSVSSYGGASGEYMGYGQGSYSLLGNESNGPNNYAQLPLDMAIDSLKSSSCQYLVVVDASPPHVHFLPYPSNVMVIWADYLGGVALDTYEKGSVLTLALLEAIKHRKSWKADQLTSFLQEEAVRQMKLLGEGELSRARKLLDGRPAPQPWVQSASLATTIAFPNLKTPNPKETVVPEFPKLKKLSVGEL